jgi:hypothetical protein
VEHRWGDRIAIEVQVLVETASKTTFRGLTGDVSSSGIFIRGVLPFPLLGSVYVELDDLRSRRRPRVRAHVVRQTEDGIGLEWDEFGPRPIRKLLAFLHSIDGVSTSSFSRRARKLSRPWTPDAPKLLNTVG